MQRVALGGYDGQKEASLVEEWLHAEIWRKPLMREK